MSTLWSKGGEADKIVETFTVGRDRELDMRLAKYDIKGSIAHIKMLVEVGLLEKIECEILAEELERLLAEVERGEFELEEDVEDIHSQVELTLTRRVGDLGKKIHSGRSRNDQVLTDLKLLYKDELEKIKVSVTKLFNLLQELSEKYKKILLPGYTHGQIAMPSSFGLWFGAYAEALVDDMHMLASSYKITNQNPLGSAAGYGSSFPLDREMTTRLLGFGSMHYNVIAAQMGRGKSERSISFAIASIASTINKLAADCCMYMSGNYGFISFPDNLTTGSSIMPHKKNPDVWEIIRGSTNLLQSLPNEIALITTNMPHGYHRDYQLLKEILFPAFDKIEDILSMTSFMLDNINVNNNILDNPIYNYLFTVEEVNRRVLEGIPFREAYRQVGIEVSEGTFVADKRVEHTHKGSIGNLCTDQIRGKFETALAEFE